MINDNLPISSMNPVPSNKPERPVVLVIDDNKDIVWFISKTLSDIYEVKESFSAMEALEMMSTVQPA